MALFDNLKKTALGKIAGVVEKTIENVSGTSIKSGDNQVNHSRVSPAAVNQDQQANHSGPAGENINQKFDRILAAEFSNLEIRKDASPESIGISAPQPCRPYSYALLRNGRAVAAIMLTPHNRDKNSAFLNAKKSAQNSNIQFLNFYMHFENENSYVINRIKSAI